MVSAKEFFLVAIFFKKHLWNFVEKNLGENLFFQCKMYSCFKEKFVTSVKSKIEISENI